MCQRGMQMAEGDRRREELGERKEEVRTGKEKKETLNGHVHIWG